MVGGATGYWIEGGEHFFYFRDADGEVLETTIRLVGTTLIWERDGLTVRIEGAPSLAAAPCASPNRCPCCRAARTRAARRRSTAHGRQQQARPGWRRRPAAGPAMALRPAAAWPAATEHDRLQRQHHAGQRRGQARQRDADEQPADDLRRDRQREQLAVRRPARHEVDLAQAAGRSRARRWWLTASRRRAGRRAGAGRRCRAAGRAGSRRMPGRWPDPPGRRAAGRRRRRRRRSRRR